MDLRSGLPFWLVRAGLPAVYPPLQRDARCDVAIIGGGITGSLIANELTQAGLDVMVLERRHLAWGSTSASTALLQYEIDEHLVDIAKRYGEADASRAYAACAEAVQYMIALAQSLGRRCELKRKRSLYYASRFWHAPALREECAARARAGLRVELLEREVLRERYGIAAPAAILSRDAAEIDPYRFAHTLFERLAKAGMRVHDRTEALSWKREGRGFTIKTDRDATVRARWMVMAGGYESAKHLPERVVSLRSSYALATEPLEAAPDWLQTTLVWESARPYLYARSTSDGRIVIGGEDDNIDLPLRRDARVARKSKRLLRKLQQLVPGVKTEIAFAWAGTFGETGDGLPYIGEHPAQPGIHYAMGYGGNGITYSAIAAQIIRASLTRKKHRDAQLLGFARRER